VNNLAYQYHISGAVKSAVAYVSEGSGTNQLEKVMGSMSIDDSGNKRDMSADNNFLYDRDGNMIENKSKKITVKYDYRGLPTEFKREVLSNENGADSVRLILRYDGAGSRITKIRERKSAGETEWTMELATHYTGIGSEIREDAINNATKVVVNLPQGLGRYDIASASESSANDNAANTVPSFEWYLKNHLGSTMLVYGTQSTSDPTVSNLGSLKAAYDYRAFGEQVDLTMPTNKVTETFTGKELDDETDLSNHGARMLDPMLGMWVSVDAKRQFNSPYLYAGNGANPVNGVDEDGDSLFLSYYQKTGRMVGFDDQKNKIVIDKIGYSGNGSGKNNPKMQSVKNTGPIPRGKWNFGDSYASKKTGPATIILEPREGTETFGRDDFRIHGDNKTHDASEGCIIMPPDARKTIINAADDGVILEVLEDEP